MAGLGGVICHDSGAPVVQSADDEKFKIDLVRRWLLEPGNDQWLLIFDNYDHPHLPGVRSPTGYDIRSFFPTCSQGSIIITSRSTKLTFSKQLKLQKLEDVNSSVAILSQRSGRDIFQGETRRGFSIFIVAVELAVACALFRRSALDCASMCLLSGVFPTTLNFELHLRRRGVEWSRSAFLQPAFT